MGSLFLSIDLDALCNVHVKFRQQIKSVISYSITTNFHENRNL